MNGLPVYQYDVGTDLVQDVDARILTEFLYYVSDLQTFDKIKLLSAYMLAHPQGSQIANHTSDKIGSELIYMSKHTSASNNVEAVNTPLSRKRPTADDLLRNSSIH
jgi:hypothetical protein